MKQYDVIIIGAGLSGIGAACHLLRRCPGKSFLILEQRAAMGGTWDLFKYPGIRSDSDMYTLGYNFKPWSNPKSIADGPSIKAYIEETARDYDLEKHIRYEQKVKAAAWSTERARWELTVEDTSTGEVSTIECPFIFSCTGYYNYAQGYSPEFEGSDDFEGDIIHPQFWPEDYDYTGKKVVVIGSGATAVTVVPSMAEKAGHVTMLQRSPTYMAALPSEDAMSNKLREIIPNAWVYRITRTRNLMWTYLFYYLSRRYPNLVRNLILKGIRKALGKDYDLRHFKPSYDPWDERPCAVPDGDMFAGIRSEKISVVTDHIERFDAKGIQLTSGERIDADIIVTATGLDLQFMGGVRLSLDGHAFDPTEKLNYKGVMLEDLPNIGFVFGYTNASWTLKADLSSEYLCRVLNLMRSRGMTMCVPTNNDPDVHAERFIDLTSGYVERGLGKFPNQGSKRPWRLYQNYILDLITLRYGKLLDGRLQLSKPNVAESDHADSPMPISAK